MRYIDIQGKWKNEFGSVMNITGVDFETGMFSGLYSSTTGATGTYRFTGLTDTQPQPGPNDTFTQTIAFAVSWRDLGGDPSDANWVSGFAGQIQMQDGAPVMRTTYLLQKNTLPTDDWEGTAIATATFRPMAAIPDHTQAPRVAFPLQRGKLSNNGGTPWTAPVGIGSPPQMLRMMFDSGTDNTWVTSTQCNSDACLAHKRFDSARSDSFKSVDNHPQPRDFGPWGKMSIVTGTDKFHIEVFDGEERQRTSTSEGMLFEQAVYYSGEQFLQLDCDGGVAIPSPGAAGKVESLMQQLLRDKKISYPVAAFWCDADSGQGECLFGAIDRDKFLPETLQWLPLQKLSGDMDYLWSVSLKAFHVGGQAVDAGITNFALDSGSSYFKGPATLINKLVSAVTDNGRLPQTVSSAKELANYPVISLMLGGQSYELHPQQYFMQLDKAYWQLGIEVLNGMPDGMLLVGSMMMEPLYCIFDAWGSQVGLARLRA